MPGAGEGGSIFICFCVRESQAWHWGVGWGWGHVTKPGTELQRCLGSEGRCDLCCVIPETPFCLLADISLPFTSSGSS